MQTILEPPLYFAKDHLFDINFHPKEDFLTCAEVTGQVSILKYTSDEVISIATFQHHKQSARVSQFFPDGLHLLTASKDTSFVILDANGTLIIQKENAHKNAINVAKVIDNNILITGDDGGSTKIWDLRKMECVYKVNEVQEAITGLLVDESRTLCLTSSLDGYLCVHDLRVQSTNEKALYAKSDCMEEDLTDICLIKGNKFVCTSTSEGHLLLFKWDYFGDFKDRITGHPNSIDSILKIDENTLMTGGEDGLLRGVSVFPNGITGVLGQHEEDSFFPISKIAMDHTRNIVASISHDNSIKFHDVSEFVHNRSKAKVQVNENEFVFSEKAEKKQIEIENEEDSEEDSENDDDDDDSDEDEQMKQQQKVIVQLKKQKKNKNKQKSVQQSIQNIKRQKMSKFFDKM